MHEFAIDGDDLPSDEAKEDLYESEPVPMDESAAGAVNENEAEQVQRRRARARRHRPPPTCYHQHLVIRSSLPGGGATLRPRHPPP